jgi:hypothetical protein
MSKNRIANDCERGKECNMRSRRHVVCSLVVASLFNIAPRKAHAQATTDSTQDQCKQQDKTDTTGLNCRTRIATTFTFTATADGGQDRYGIVVLTRGKWQLENINWVNPTGTDAVSLFLAGRQFKVARGVEVSILAGPWYEHYNRAWDEAVIDTDVEWRGRRIKFVSINRWGVPVKASGSFFDSHTQAISGFPGLPTWIGANAQEKYTSDGFDRLWAGPMFTTSKRSISLRCVPYWDFRRKTVDLRVSVSYSLTLQ